MSLTLVEEGEENHDNSKLGLAILKIVSIVLLLALAFVIAISPTKLKTFHSSPKLLSYANSFSAGLFLGMGLLHLFPESVVDFERHLNGSKTLAKAYPFPFLILLLSFAFILLLEKVLFRINHSHDGAEPETQIENKNEIIQIDASEESQTLIEPSAIEERREIRKNEKQNTTILLGPEAILVALFIHSIFEGIAIGIQTSFAPALDLVIAVFLHKWAEALTLGIAFSKEGISKMTAYISIIVFVIAGPLGVVIGWIMTSSPPLVESIFKAISAGTFLYIASVDLVVEEFVKSENLVKKFLLFVIGAIFMALIILFQ